MSKYTDTKNRSYGPKIEKISLSKDNAGQKLFLAGVFLVVGVIFIASAVYRMLAAKPGLILVETYSSYGKTIAGDFDFYYSLGEGEMSPSSEKRELTNLYSGITSEIYEAFNTYEESEKFNNLCYLNSHINTEAEVPKVLYDALKKASDTGFTYIYMAPIYETYNGIFSCEEDYQTESFDPSVNPDVRADFENILKFVNDREAVNLEFLGDNKLILHVSKAYEEFAKNDGITKFVDFYLYENAFAIDVIADTLQENGFDKGYLESFDGYVRVLSGYDKELNISLYVRDGSRVSEREEKLTPEPGSSFVALRDYPVNGSMMEYMYEKDDGSYILPYISMDEGVVKLRSHNVYGYSVDKGCAEILPLLLQEFIGDGTSDKLDFEY
ncbi:MAG: hypothetical protein K6D96_03850 [Acetatifactor sp.]|nr:hypothetical protein [Acetatifactor sp.]